MEVVSIDFIEREKHFALPRLLAETHPLAIGLKAHPKTRGADGVNVESRAIPAFDPLLSNSAHSDPLRETDPLRPSDPLQDVDEDSKARAQPTSSGGRGAAQYEAASREWDQSKTALMHQFTSSGTITVSAVRVPAHPCEGGSGVA